MDLAISSLTQIFTNRAKIHNKIVVAGDLTEFIREEGVPLQKSHRFCANLMGGPRGKWGVQPSPMALSLDNIHQIL